MKKRIMIDLDVVTVAEWDSEKDALTFTAKIKKGEFDLVTPYLLLEHLSKWKYKQLASKIEHFYNLYSIKIITAQETLDKIKSIGLDRDKLISNLMKNEVKEEDAALVVIASIFGMDYLVTFNRKHRMGLTPSKSEPLMRFSSSFFNLLKVFKQFFSHTPLNFISQFNKFLSSHFFWVFHITNKVKSIYKTFA